MPAIKPPRVTTKVEGLRELRAALEEMKKAASTRIMKQAVEAGAEPMRATAEANAPRDTTLLAESVETSSKLTARQRRLAGKSAKRQADGGFRSAKSTGVEVHVGPGADKSRKAPPPSGLLQEFGTRNHPAQPFLRPAWDRHKGEALTIITEALRRAIDKAAKRAAKRALKAKR